MARAAARVILRFPTPNPPSSSGFLRLAGLLSEAAKVVPKRSPRLKSVRDCYHARMSRALIRRDRAMPEDLKAGPTCVSAPEFLEALERSEVLPDGKWQEVRDRYGRTTVLDDSLALAHQLIEDGTLTKFQARRLLKGKKGLSFGRYVLLDHIGQGARGRVFKRDTA